MSVEQQTIGPGSSVSMHFCLTLEDGTVADTTRVEADAENASKEGLNNESEPLAFVMGDGSLIEGLEMALMGLKAGDTQTISIGPDLAFGFRDDENIHDLARSEFTDELPLERGVIIGFDTPSGEEIPGLIMEVDDDQVKVDFNHPLAGHEITFEVEILTVEEGVAANDDRVE